MYISVYKYIYTCMMWLYIYRYTYILQIVQLVRAPSLSLSPIWSPPVAESWIPWFPKRSRSVFTNQLCTNRFGYRLHLSSPARASSPNVSSEDTTAKAVAMALRAKSPPAHLPKLPEPAPIEGRHLTWWVLAGPYESWSYTWTSWLGITTYIYI